MFYIYSFLSLVVYCRAMPCSYCSFTYFNQFYQIDTKLQGSNANCSAYWEHLFSNVKNKLINLFRIEGNKEVILGTEL